MDCKIIKERRFNSEWNPEISDDIDVYHNIDAEKQLTEILTEEINKEFKKNVMQTLEKRCLDDDERNGICASKPNKIRLKPSKNKKKPKQKEYFGDMRMENGYDSHIAYIDGKKYRVHKSTNDVPDSVVYTKWQTECVGTVGNYGDMKNIKTRYAKDKTINDIYTGTTYGDGEILTTNKI